MYLWPSQKVGMARYESIMKISGTIDNLVFYQLNGVNVVRRKSGFNSADYKKKASYKKVRENSSEFGHCSKSGKMLRNALYNYIAENGDKYLYQKVAKLMTEIKDLDDTSERGKRSVEKGLAKGEAGSLLKNFTFGNFENVKNDLLRSDSLFSVTIQNIAQNAADEIELVTLKPDFVSYKTEKKSQIIPVNRRGIYEFDKHFDNEASLLYFAVLRKDGNILKLGFV